MNLAQRLILLWELLQRDSTTFGEVLSLSAQCCLDGRQVLADHFQRQHDLLLVALEA